MNHSQQALIDRLHYLELFELFPASARSALFNKAIAKSCKAGEIIYRRGDEGSYLGAIMSGRVRVSTHSAEGRGILFAMVEKGEVFGETALIDGLPRAYDASAESDCTFLMIRREDFLPILCAQPDAMLSVIRMLCHRLRAHTETLELIALQNMPGRLAHHLLRLAQHYGVEENGKIVIRAGLNQIDLAQQLAASRESVNRQLKIFAAKNWLSQHDDAIILQDVENLEKIANPFSAAVDPRR
jgi:CRP/FNR family transcriptional regulator, cyclic AMP receptor protein